MAHSFDASGVSNAELLHAINGLRDVLAETGGNQASGNGHAEPNGAAEGDEPTEAVQVEIARMVRMLSHAKNEIAAIKHPLSGDDRINSASSQLDAIVEATEGATQEILSASEKIEEGINKLGALHPLDDDTTEIVGDIAQHVVSILEACNFQDITGATHFQGGEDDPLHRRAGHQHDRDLGRRTLHRHSVAAGRRCRG